jgi:hypothetical protein
MQRRVFACLIVVLALSCLPVSQAEERAAPPVVHCTPTRHCIHVFRVGPSTSTNSHAAWDSRIRFRSANLAISLTYSPQLESDPDLRRASIADCGIHFWLNGRFNGVATRCGDGRLPLHLQIANVHRKPLRVVVSYWESRIDARGLASARRR